MLDGLGDIAWESLRDDSGQAGDIPALLLAARTSGAVHQQLRDRLNYSEFDVSEAAAAAWPFVLELAACPDTPGRAWLLDTLYASNAEVGALGVEPEVHPSWLPTWEAAKPALLALLDDASVEMRRSALFVVGQGRGDSSLVLPALSRRWAVETDPATRLCIVDAAVEFAGFGDEAAVSWLLALAVPDDEPEARMLVSAAVRPDAEVIVRGLTGNLELFLEATSFEMRPDQVLEHVLWLLRDKVSARIELGLKLLEERPWRREALGILRSAVETWRSPADRLLPIVPGWLADPDPQLRHFAVWLVGFLRAAQYADLLAESAHDGAEISARHRIGDVALWALARCGRDVSSTYTLPAPLNSRTYDIDALSVDDLFPPKRMRAWYARWRRTGEVGELEQLATKVLRECVERLRRGAGLEPDALVAARYLVELGVRVPFAEEMLASDRRLAGSGSWLAFDEDVEMRALLERLK